MAETSLLLSRINFLNSLATKTYIAFSSMDN